MTGPTDWDSERDLLALTLLTPSRLRGLLVGEKLTPEHFSNSSHRAVFKAIVQISDRGEEPTPTLLSAELNGRIAPVLQEILAVMAHGEYGSDPAPYARRLKDLHRRRQMHQAGNLLLEAAFEDDGDKLAQAEALLSRPEEAQQSTWSGYELADWYSRRLDEKPEEAWHWPWASLDRWTGGGLRRQQVVLIGGWTANGKSVIYDQILEGMAKQGLKCHSYINEMSVAERMDRTAARLSGVPFERVFSRNMTGEQEVAVLKAMSRVQVGMTECAGWTAAEIARHIRWNRWDVAGVDIVHEIAHREERDLAEIAQTLRAAAKSVNCALVACVHLNDNRVVTPKRPMPVLRDVRGSGMLVRGADIVLFIHRDDDDEGVPQDSGILSALKIRNGQPSTMGIQFDAPHMQFLARAA